MLAFRQQYSGFQLSDNFASVIDPALGIIVIALSLEVVRKIILRHYTWKVRYNPHSSSQPPQLHPPPPPRHALPLTPFSPVLSPLPGHLHSEDQRARFRAQAAPAVLPRRHDRAAVRGRGSAASGGGRWQGRGHALSHPAGFGCPLIAAQLFLLPPTSPERAVPQPQALHHQSDGGAGGAALDACGAPGCSAAVEEPAGHAGRGGGTRRPEPLPRFLALRADRLQSLLPMPPSPQASSGRWRLTQRRPPRRSLLQRRQRRRAADDRQPVPPTRFRRVAAEGELRPRLVRGCGAAPPRVHGGHGGVRCGEAAAGVGADGLVLVLGCDQLRIAHHLRHRRVLFGPRDVQHQPHGGHRAAHILRPLLLIHIWQLVSTHAHTR